MRLMYGVGRLVIFRSVFLWPVSRPQRRALPPKPATSKESRTGEAASYCHYCSVL
jgi:hypothetical protein